MSEAEWRQHQHQHQQQQHELIYEQQQQQQQQQADRVVQQQQQQHQAQVQVQQDEAQQDTHSRTTSGIMMNDNSNGLGDHNCGGMTGGNFVADADVVNSSTELVIMSVNNDNDNNKEGSFHYEDNNDDVEDRQKIRDAREININTESNNNNGHGKTSGISGTYPADCYSFLALYSPLDHFGFWLFGFMVWLFQIAFLILLVHTKHSTTEDVPNPNDGFPADFIPSNVPTLARATQFFAILSYCFFADESVKDVAAAVETFPKFNKVEHGDKVCCMVFSCILRFIQGMVSYVLRVKCLYYTILYYIISSILLFK